MTEGIYGLKKIVAEDCGEMVKRMSLGEYNEKVMLVEEAIKLFGEKYRGHIQAYANSENFVLLCTKRCELPSGKLVFGFEACERLRVS